MNSFVFASYFLLVMEHTSYLLHYINFFPKLNTKQTHHQPLQ